MLNINFFFFLNLASLKQNPELFNDLMMTLDLVLLLCVLCIVAQGKNCVSLSHETLKSKGFIKSKNFTLQTTKEQVLFHGIWINIKFFILLQP